MRRLVLNSAYNRFNVALTEDDMCVIETRDSHSEITINEAIEKFSATTTSSGILSAYIFDTETKELEFVNNPYRIFYKIKYDDSKLTMEHLKNIDYSQYEKAYIKIVVLHKSNPHVFDALVDNLYKVNPIDINIVEDFSEASNNNFEVVDQAEDTLTILSNYIDAQALQVEPEKLKTVMKELYLEALSTEHIE